MHNCLTMDDKEKGAVLSLIITTYVPFLKKLLAHLEKKKDTQPKSFEKLKYVYKTFCESDPKEKIEVYEACKNMLERWHKRYKDTKASGGDKKNSSINTSVASEDSQSDTPLSKTEGSKSRSTAAPALSTSVVSFSTAQSNENISKKSCTSHSDGVYVQDEIEIESSDSSSHASTSVSTETKTEKWIPILNIKKEKDPLPETTTASATPVTANYQKNTTPVPPPAESAPVQPPTEPKEIVFVCASCQFRTTNEGDFMKHARTDHRTDLSLWCKQCGKCFSNAGVLVSHIKESNCQKEDMIYRCGVKDCTFETPSGQTFVHHLRHCHKGSPFIFCIHCQKIFTLPHCLILHMQNECPFKDKNRRNPGACPPPAPASPATPTPAPTITPVKITPKPITPAPNVSVPVTPALKTPTPSPISSSTAKKNAVNRKSKGRGRGSRVRFSESSDSDDPDDPSWRPEESLNNQPVRRSARWAKKVIEAKEPEFNDSDSCGGKHKKAERPSKTFYYCPCCEFSALFKSLLDDHYVTDHKHAKKNACSVCNVKFESKQFFLDHFERDHRKEKEQIAEKEKEKSDSEAVTEKQQSSPNDSQAPIPMEIVSQPKPPEQNSINSPIIIPYQTAIQEKLQKESKLKSFEDLKSSGDVEKMKTETKLQHFFKCVIFNCSYTTDDNFFYVNHLNEHKGKKLHCAYCLEDYSDAQVLTDHMLKDHGRRCYQCSLCFYRGSSKPHVQIHIRNTHSGEKGTVLKCSQHLPPDYSFKNEKEEETDLTTTYPYVCAVGDCTFRTYDPKEFKRHNDLTHRSVSVFFCYYCKVDFISFKRLMSHYHLHGINNYQCTYCVHGSDTKEEILVHLCNSHADKPFKVHVRTPEDNSTTVTKSGVDTSSNAVKVSEVSKPNNIIIKTGNVYKDSTYPAEVPCFAKDMFCRLGSCGELLDDINCYVKHLDEQHCALNYLCPYCAFAADKISEFQNHLVCHGPHLFACPEENCLFYSHEESDVALHMINASHHQKISSPRVIRKKTGCVVTKPQVDVNILLPSHTSSSAYVCPFCSYRCISHRKIKNHLYIELNYRRFLCNLCKIKCHSRNETKQHFRTVHSHHNIKCTVESNATIEHYVRHFLGSKVQKFVESGLKIEKENWMQKSGLPASNCSNCSLSLPTTVELHHHAVACLSHDYSPYICNNCGAKTTNLVRMKCHTNEVHPGGQIKYSVFQNKLLEEQHGRLLQDMRIKYLQEVVLSAVDKSTVGQPTLIPKQYKCAYCKFIDIFRSNIEKHCLGCHKNKTVEVEKIKGAVPSDTTTVECSNPSMNMITSDSSCDSSEPMDTSTREQHCCVYCTKKVKSLSELEEHVIKNHSLSDDGIYSYIYCPDPNRQFSQTDSELYDCAYCSVSQENLYHLQRHWNNLHSAAEFHVRGHKAKNGETLSCEHCDCKVLSEDQLAKHYQFNHPSKSFQKPVVSAKRKNSVTPQSNKRPKCVPETYQCSYCKEESDMILKITAHCEYAHPNLPVKYKAKNEDATRNNVVACELCSFVGDKILLGKHLSQKHENSVQCGHCSKYFESSTSLEAHTATAHEGLPSKALKSSDNSSTDQEVNATTNREGYDSIDLNALTVHLKDDATSMDAKVPVISLAKMFEIFPKVIVKDFKKSK